MAETKLKPHQKRVLKKLDKTDRLLLYHGLGTGKTLTGLAAAEKYKVPAKVIGPASLRGNFEGEAKKHNIKADVDYSSYAKPNATAGEKYPLLIYDEAHRMGRIQSQRSKYPDKFKAQKQILMTGTPIRNSPTELIPILRGLGIEAPRDEKRFNKMFTEQVPVRRSFMDWIKGRPKLTVTRGKNLHILEDALKGKVDYQPTSKKDFPKTNVKHIEVPMSRIQRRTYNMAARENPDLAYKVKYGIPPSKSESGRMNAFLGATRQISNTPSSYNLKAKPSDSPKLMRIVEDIKTRYNENPDYKGVTYSNYLSSGIEPLAKKLKKHNIPYAKYTGETPKDLRKKVIEDYNSGKVRQLLISGAGSEGLDLKKTTMLQVMEPHWNQAKIDQVKGRPVRYKSHAGLPIDKQNVDIRHYYSTYKRGKKLTADQYLKRMSDRKSKVNQDFLNVLKRAGDE